MDSGALDYPLMGGIYADSGKVVVGHDGRRKAAARAGQVGCWAFHRGVAATTVSASRRPMCSDMRDSTARAAALMAFAMALALDLP